MARNNGQVGANLADLEGKIEVKKDERQKLVMEIQIYEESIFRVIYEGEQAVQRDEISPFDLGAALTGLEMGTGVLPPNCVFFRQRPEGVKIGIYIPPTFVRRVIKVDGVGTFMIPLPGMVLAGEGKQYQIFAIKELWPKAETRLYQVPMPNVHYCNIKIKEGLICSGSVEFPAAGVENIHEAARLFFESEFNKDLVEEKSLAFPKDVLKQWEAVLEENLYPLDDLVETELRMEDLLR